MYIEKETTDAAGFFPISKVPTFMPIPSTLSFQSMLGSFSSIIIYSDTKRNTK